MFARLPSRRAFFGLFPAILSGSYCRLPDAPASAIQGDSPPQADLVPTTTYGDRPITYEMLGKVPVFSF